MIEATNHGPEPAPLHLLPQVWFRNTWAWGRDDRTPALRRLDPPDASAPDVEAVECDARLPRPLLLVAAEGTPEVLVCDNETNAVALFGAPNEPDDATPRTASTTASCTATSRR